MARLTDCTVNNAKGGHILARAKAVEFNWSLSQQDGMRVSDFRVMESSFRKRSRLAGGEKTGIQRRELQSQMLVVSSCWELNRSFEPHEKKSFQRSTVGEPRK